MADKEKGFIKLYRESLDHWTYGLNEFSNASYPFDKWHAWCDLLLTANFAETKRLYKGKVQVTRPGQLNVSIQYLANRWGWSRRKTTTFLSILESDGMVTTKSTTHGTTITIENWGKWQLVGTTKCTTDDTTSVATKVSTGVTTKVSTRVTHNKNDKNVKKEKNVKNPPNPPEGGMEGEVSIFDLPPEEFMRRMQDL